MLRSLSRHLFVTLLVALIAGCGESGGFFAPGTTSTSLPTSGSLGTNIYLEAPGATYTVDQGRGTLRLRNALQAVQISPEGDVTSLKMDRLLGALQSSLSLVLITAPDQGSQRLDPGRVLTAQLDGSDLVLRFEGDSKLPAIQGEVLLLGTLPTAPPDVTAQSTDRAVGHLRSRNKVSRLRELMAQVSSEVQGTVTDTHGRPVPGAAVTVSGSSQKTTTDALGRYRIRTSPGYNTVTVKDLGYETQTQDFNVAQGGTATKNFVLQPNNDMVIRIVIRVKSGRLQMGQAGSATLTFLKPLSPSLVDTQGAARKLSLDDLKPTLGSLGTVRKKVVLHVIGQGGEHSENVELVDANRVADDAIFTVLLPADSVFSNGDLGEATLAITR